MKVLKSAKSHHCLVKKTTCTAPASSCVPHRPYRINFTTRTRTIFDKYRLHPEAHQLLFFLAVMRFVFLAQSSWRLFLKRAQYVHIRNLCLDFFPRQLSEENANLQVHVEKESNEKKRLSRTNEELLWRLQTGELSPRMSPSSSPIHRPSSGPGSPARPHSYHQ